MKKLNNENLTWDHDTLELAKEALRISSSLNSACSYLSKKIGRNVNRFALYRAFRKNQLPNPSEYLDGGKSAAFRGDHDGHSLINKKTTAPGYIVKGVSSLVKKDGTVSQQWVKTNIDMESRIEALRDAILSLAEPISGLSEVVSCDTKKFNDSVLAVYPMGDPHIGMYAWHEESGENFDLKIAERDLFSAVDYLVHQAPPSKNAVIVNLGDFFHSDNLDNKTRRSGNVLDVDGRFAKIMRVGLRTIKRCIDRALKKHETVTVFCAIGNHDDHTSMMLAIALAEYYSNNSRVKIETSPANQYYYRFGKVLLGITHGHTIKPERLPGVMATDRAKDWGETVFRHWLTGHVHHDQMKEYPGCTFESFRTLAAKDAYAASHGYRADRDMKCIVYHKEFGEIVRYTSNIRLIKAFQNR